ncbi:RecF/RecN/SMC N terminal domain-containing protein [Cardiosporidium cionae]|uniref:RecF/RecN/SMC N terminal domain-containing protein n=1 Tax=Cardiosporidium cionae TaxID=476202 RepID=A0ABQ7J9V2_9APIC|nr:RecF/RecN/SMC N terminal domain-containing protein [Cardiosporidium cionae]|eukprot:KAF8820764.1 RecF/RecN/SMC N terminal domain-containing protein [Cardiosporidium cionae]
MMRGRLGGKTQEKGRVDTEKATALHNQLQKFSQTVNALKTEKESLEQQINLCSENIRNLQQKSRLEGQNAQNYSSQLNELKKRLSDGNSNELSTSEEKAKMALCNAIEEITLKRTKFMNAVKLDELEVERLRHCLENAGGKPMKDAKQRLLLAERDLTKKRDYMETLRRQSKYSYSDAEKLKKNINKLSKEYEELQNAYEKYKEAIVEYEERGQDIDDQLRANEDLLKEQNVRCMQAKEKYSEIDKRLEEISLEEVDRQYAIQRLQQKINTYEAKIAIHQQKLENLREKQLILPNLDALPTLSMDEELLEETLGEEDEDVSLDDEGEAIENVNEEETPNEESFPTIGEANDEELLHTFFDNSCIFCLEDIESVDTDAIEKKIAMKQEELKSLPSNLAVIVQYLRKYRENKRNKRSSFMAQTKRDAIRKACDILCAQRKMQFIEGFNVIAAKVKEIYQMIAKDGDAELELVDATDPFAEGILFSVRPPKKSWKHIQNLSGGEKTLSSLSLVFALHYYKPTPVYFMDEIDAALDFRNVSIISHYIKDETKNAQFIVVSLRNQMFEHFNHMVGIYKTHEVTKSISVNPTMYSRLGKSWERQIIE